jgi:prevent-host-death family protein
MRRTTISSRDFNQNASGAKRAAKKGPVFITDRGRPAHVLLTFEAYKKLLGPGPSLLDAVAQKKGGDFDFEPPRCGDTFFHPADLS